MLPPSNRHATSALRLVSLLGALVALLAGFQFIARPWYLAWGATEAERHWVLPGDEIVPDAASQSTRAITIRAPADRVWPWLAQIGQDRGGFYSYDLLENAVGCEMPTEDLLRPEKQAWRPGDRLWMYPENKAGGIGFATLRTYEPGRALGFATRPAGVKLSEAETGSWSFIVMPTETQETRLIVRGRMAEGRSALGTAFDRFIFEPAHFAMERRMMVGLAALAQGAERSRWTNHIQVLLWTSVFVLFVAAGVLVFRRPDWARVLAGFVLAGVVFQILTFVQPPVLIGLILTCIPLAMLVPAPRSGFYACRRDLRGP